jgi:DNA-binding MarR family transcriptional regulator
MSTRDAALARLSELIPLAQAVTFEVDEAAAAHLGINRTDLRCLGVIFESAGISASELAERVGLTRGAMTTALDRLERATLVRRVPDAVDRRGVNLEVTPSSQRALRTIWGPIRTEGLEQLRRYSERELSVLVTFFEQYCALQRNHAERVRGLPSRHGPSPRRKT